MVEKRIIEGECPSYYGTKPIPDDILPPPPEEIWLAEQHVDAREAERLVYEEACGNYYDAQQRHFEARIAWGTDYAEEHYPVPDAPVPPCDGSYTDPWESTEGVHGAVARQYIGRGVERHPLGLPDTLAGLL